MEYVCVPFRRRMGFPFFSPLYQDKVTSFPFTTEHTTGHTTGQLPLTNRLSTEGLCGVFLMLGVGTEAGTPGDQQLLQ